MSNEPIKKDPDTTGHSWDGVEEFNNPLPRWWLWTFYATIIWGLAYTIAYPAWPLVKGATSGLLGYSTRAEVAADIKAWKDRNAKDIEALASVDLTTIDKNSPLYTFAVNDGTAIFRANCSQCHGQGAAGSKGYPNLLDNDWLWGGDIEAIHTTILHGIRSPTDEDSRAGQGIYALKMPSFGKDGTLEPAQIDQVVEYVLMISGQEHDEAKATEGATVFADQCVSCHGEDAKGNRDMGAPNLTDRIWLYGGSREVLHETLQNGRGGEMPAWAARLSPADINAVALYVHQLGGGE